jgi:predicted metal-dependent enzyme (double-stranded beta helix superfamily)
MELVRPTGRDLDRTELRAVVVSLAGRPGLWRDRVRLDPGQRHYERLLSDPHLTVWLNCWMDDQDTGFHDHDTSAGAVAVVEGAVLEERLRLDGPPRQVSFDAGGVFDFGPSTIHRVRHGGGSAAITLHAYSPPLVRTGSYAVRDGGVLERRSLAANEELRPPVDSPGEPRLESRVLRSR